MNYTQIYNQLIERAKQRKSVEGYKEIHHIIPRSEGGTDESDNLVELTGREHFIAHKLLWMENSTFSRSAAFMMMSNSRKITWGSFYEAVRKEFNESENHPLRNQYVRKKQLELMMGIPKSEEHRKKISEANKGKPKSKEHIENMKASLPDRSGENNSMHGKGTPVIIDGIEYPNQRTAADSIGIKYNLMNYRMKSDFYPNYIYKK
jgi:hypothetical protein